MLRIKYFILGFLLAGSFPTNLWGESTVRVGSWKYLVKRTTIKQDNLANKTEKHVDRAFVFYGAGAKHAGGQIKTVPQVVYVDEELKPFPKAVYFESAIVPLNPKKLGLIRKLPEYLKLPEDLGSRPDSPVPGDTLPKSFSILPLKPEAELKSGLSWSRTWYVFYGVTPDFPFPVTIEHEVKGYEQKKGRRCALIEYTIAGDLKMADHPEWFTEEELREARAEFSLKGSGTAYFDPADGIIVEKEQAISWTRFGEKLWRFEDGKVGWKPTVDDKKSVRIRVSLQPD